MKTVAPAVALLAGLSIVLTGCGGSGGKRVPLHFTEGVLPVGFKPFAPQFLSPTRLFIVTGGSSGCPSVPRRMYVQNTHTIRIDIAMSVPPHATACPLDLTTTRWTIDVNPREIDVHHRLRIVYSTDGENGYVQTAPPLSP
jgi:hypothetical protein